MLGYCHHHPSSMLHLVAGYSKPPHIELQHLLRRLLNQDMAQLVMAGDRIAVAFVGDKGVPGHLPPTDVGGIAIGLGVHGGQPLLHQEVKGDLLSGAVYPGVGSAIKPL